MVDCDSMEHTYWYSLSEPNFVLRKLSHDFKLCSLSILHEFQRAIFLYCFRLITWLGTQVVLYVLYMLNLLV